MSIRGFKDNHVRDYPDENGDMGGNVRGLAPRKQPKGFWQARTAFCICCTLALLLASTLAIIGLTLFFTGHTSVSVQAPSVDSKLLRRGHHDHHDFGGYAFPNETRTVHGGTETGPVMHTTTLRQTTTTFATEEVEETIMASDTAVAETVSGALDVTASDDVAVTTTHFETVVLTTPTVETIDGGTTTRYQNATLTQTLTTLVTLGLTETIVETIEADSTADTIIDQTVTVVQSELVETTQSETTTLDYIPSAPTSRILQNETSDISTTEVRETTTTVTPTVVVTLATTTVLPSELSESEAAIGTSDVIDEALTTVESIRTIVGGTTTVHVTSDKVVTETLISTIEEPDQVCEVASTAFVTITATVVASPSPEEEPATSVVTEIDGTTVTYRTTIFDTRVQTIVHTVVEDLSSSQFATTTSDVLAEPGEPLSTTSLPPSGVETATESRPLTTTLQVTETLDIVETSEVARTDRVFTTVTIPGRTHGTTNVVTITLQPEQPTETLEMNTATEVQTIVETEVLTSILTNVETQTSETTSGGVMTTVIIPGRTTTVGAQTTITVQPAPDAMEEVTTIVEEVHTTEMVVPITEYQTLTRTDLVTHTVLTTIDGSQVEQKTTRVEEATEVVTITQTIGRNTTLIVTAVVETTGTLTTMAPSFDPAKNSTITMTLVSTGHVVEDTPMQHTTTSAVLVSGVEKRADSLSKGGPFMSLLLAIAGLLILF